MGCLLKIKAIFQQALDSAPVPNRKDFYQLAQFDQLKLFCFKR
jgi:hypothetical protein